MPIRRLRFGESKKAGQAELASENTVRFVLWCKVLVGWYLECEG